MLGQAPLSIVAPFGQWPSIQPMTCKACQMPPSPEYLRGSKGAALKNYLIFSDMFGYVHVSAGPCRE